MEDSHYDEFGNYIGPALSDSDQEEEEEDEQQQQLGHDEDDDDEAMHDADDAGPHMGYAADDEGDPGNAIVLAEDKKYYPTAEETYGAETETLVMEEDAQPLETPIIAPVIRKRHEKLLEAPLATHYSGEFLAALSSNPELIRNVAVVGALHHGKTTLLDMLVEQTHDVAALGIRNSTGKPLRFTDTRVDEQARGISIKAMPMSLVLEGGSGKSYLVNLIDCPGHVNFNDEVTAAMRLADGVLLVVDVLEGVGAATERAVQQAVQEGLVITLLISKIDRLITELKLPPADAYHKIAFTIEEVNAVIRTAGGGDAAAAAANGTIANGTAAAGSTPLLDPVAGNVAFAAAGFGYSFTLRSFAALYRGVCGDAPKDVLLVDEFARRLWGDVWYYPEERVFRRKPPQLGADRSFVTFILEPLYKLTSAVVGEHPKAIERLLGDDFGIHLKSSAYSQDVKPLLKEVCSKVFGSASGLVDMLVQHVPSSKDATAAKVARLYTGPQDPNSPLMQFMTSCSRTGPLVVHVAKLFPKNDASSFDAYGRIFSGTLRPGDEVRVLGEGFTPDDDEDSGDAVVSNVWLYQARYRVPLGKVTAGNLVLLEGLDGLISKTATVVGRHLDEEVHVFKPLRFQTRSVMKIATEPLQPSELPKMVEGLRKINKSYPLAVTRVEESGEHTLLGTGELYLDSIMKDLREMYADIEVKVADPVVAFCETVVETSSLKCFAETPNRRNKLTMIAEPLDKGLAEDIESGKISITWPARKLGTYLVDTYEWDPLAARSVWAFGPAADGPNVLLDDTLAGEVDKGLLGAVRDSIVQGFQWGTREGPLCDEPIRNVKFKVTDALIADEPLHRGGGQVIPTARRVCYSAFLMATPRLMEPMYYVEIQTPADCIAAIYNVLAKRRGHVTKDLPRPGTPIFTVKAYLPVIESFGFETDLRYHTQGQAFCQCVFDHWAVVPGDPLDRGVVLRPLEPAPIAALAREFCVKTRRRKGMSEDVSVAKFFDDPMLLELAKQDTEFQQMAF
uniref:SNU114 homolog n=1 Tax=Tetradesmus obliquus TaxID=3088 RepID=A0A383VQF5_TETOB|eukprot:jgi/Sobl393_1/11564/SZX66982.1